MNAERTPLPHMLCTHLCCKKLQMISDDRDVCLEDFHSASFEACWCHHTQTDTGPDGGWVTWERCGPHRSCYVALDRNTGLGYRYRQQEA